MDPLWYCDTCKHHHELSQRGKVCPKNKQELIEREIAAGRMDAALDEENDLWYPCNVHVHRRDAPDELLVCHHCDEVIYDFPLIEVGPITGKNFHADKKECSAASIRFQIENDSIWWVINGPDEPEEE